jgi:hypothetical protein
VVRRLHRATLDQADERSAQEDQKMNTKHVGSVVVATAIALGIGASGTTARAEGNSASEESSSRVSPEQQRLADATMKLENAFNDQFIAGKIDRSALAGAIDDVVQAAPESARPKMTAHIDQVLQAGAALASRMTPEQRTAAVTPPQAENIGKTQQAQLAAWGYPGAIGWGGYGAFAFPVGYGLGYGLGGIGYGLGYGGWGYGYGTGYGLGWGW